jgi:hypothetical protein
VPPVLPAAVLVDRLLGRLQRNAAGPDDADDVVQVSDAAGEPVIPGDRQHITFPEEVEHGPGFFPALRRVPIPPKHDRKK